MSDSEFDKTEVAIRDAVDQVAQEAGHKQWPDKEWTRRLKNALVVLGQDRGYRTYASTAELASAGEWLFDVTWTEESAGFLRSLPLVLEMEWSPGGIDEDFQKLVVARAQHRVLLFNYPPGHNDDLVLERVIKNVRRFSSSSDTDRYLFGGWSEESDSFQWHRFVGRQALSMELPKRIELPFFAYGLFKPGQLGFHRLTEFVHHSEAAEIAGNLWIRDGLPLLETVQDANASRVGGYFLHFREENSRQAYSRITDLEPERQYSWSETLVTGRLANVLTGRSPRKGSVESESEWDGKCDPLFTSALDVIEETLHAHRVFAWDLKPLFRLQMAYLLLWSSIERYVSLRYHLGDRVIEKVSHLADEAAFVEALLRVNPTRRVVYRSHRPSEKVILDAGNPKKAIDYYYQVRSNITHRGKAVGADHDRLESALKELLTIFREVLKSAFTPTARGAE